jgi:hypothetical protein
MTAPKIQVYKTEGWRYVGWFRRWWEASVRLTKAFLEAPRNGDTGDDDDDDDDDESLVEILMSLSTDDEISQ